MQQIQYYKSAWGDIKNSPGWFGKLCLLALVNFIPVFGQIVTFGYLYGWAREIAWGTHEPMPARIFGNEDGKLYRRGWFVLVLTFVAGLIPGIIMQVGSSMQGMGIWGIASRTHAAASSLVSGLGAVVSLVGIVCLLLLMILAWIGSMRIAIYDRLSAGFQVGKLWKMFRHDTNGIMRIFGMYLLVSLIVGVILTIVFFIIFTFIMFAGIAGLAASGYNVAAIGHMTDAQVAAFSLQFLASAGFVGFFGIILLAFLAYLAEMFISLLVARALGYWTMQFDVPRWRGQDDPMPFETAPPAAAAQPVNPVPPAPQGSYPPYYGQQGEPTAPVVNAVPIGTVEPVDSAPDAPAYEPTAPEPVEDVVEEVSETQVDSAEASQDVDQVEPGQLSGFTYAGTASVQPPVTPSGADPSAETVPDLLVVIPEAPAEEADGESE